MNLSLIPIFFILNSILFVVKSNPIGFTKNLEEGDFFEGDILGVEKDEKGAYLMPYKYSEPWPNGQVPYLIDSDSKYTQTELNAIESGLKHIEEATKLDDKQVIKFIKLSSEANLGEYPTAVRVYRGEGCSSYVGMRRDVAIQNVSIGNGCAHKGTVAHEFMHALGFLHENSRPDRDDWVTVYYENIIPGHEHNFDKYSSSPNPSGIVIGLMEFPYDYGSLMHYGTDYFSKNGKPTLLPKVSGAPIGNREALSFQDILEVNAAYKSKSIDELLSMLQLQATTTVFKNSSLRLLAPTPIFQIATFLLLFLIYDRNPIAIFINF